MSPLGPVTEREQPINERKRVHVDGLPLKAWTTHEKWAWGRMVGYVVNFDNGQTAVVAVDRCTPVAARSQPPPETGPSNIIHFPVTVKN